jgi:hypothetical protein
LSAALCKQFKSGNNHGFSTSSKSMKNTNYAAVVRNMGLEPAKAAQVLRYGRFLPVIFMCKLNLNTMTLPSGVSFLDPDGENGIIRWTNARQVAGQDKAAIMKRMTVHLA